MDFTANFLRHAFYGLPICFGLTGSAMAQVYNAPEDAVIRNHIEACDGWDYDRVGFENEEMAYLNCVSESGHAWFPIKLNCFEDVISLRFEENPDAEQVGASNNRGTLIWTFEAQDVTDIFTYFGYEEAVPDWATYFADAADHPVLDLLQEADTVSVTFLFASAIDQFPLDGSRQAIEQAMRTCDQG